MFVCLCVCVHKLTILGATIKHLTQALITLYLVLHAHECPCVYVYVRVSMCERVKGPMCPLILNIDILVGELHLLIPYPAPRDKAVRREETGEVKEER